MSDTQVFDFLQTNRSSIFWLLIGLGLLVHALAALWADVRKRRAFEDSRREIAAYVAEGSISAEHASMLLAQKPRRGSVITAGIGLENDDPDKRLASAVSDCELDEDDARKLIDQRPSLDDNGWARAVDLTLSGMPVDDAVRLAKARKRDAAPTGSQAMA